MNKFRNKSGNDLSRRGEGLLNGVDLSPRNRLQSLAIGCAVLILQFEDRTKKIPHSFLSFDENSKEVKSLYMYHIVNFFLFCKC